MNLNEENCARFDRYLENEMPNNERAAFEEELNTNQELNQEYNKYNAFIATLTGTEIKNFTENLSRWDREERQTKPSKTKIYTLRFIAAAAVFAIGLVFSVNYFFNSPTTTELMATYFQPYDNVITTRGEKEDLDAAFLNYEEQNYAAALQLFSNTHNNETAYFYAGECEMVLKNYAQAVIYFEQTTEMNGLFAEIATFHKALAYLGNGDEAQAKMILTSLDKTSDHYQDAQRLLRDLK